MNCGTFHWIYRESNLVRLLPRQNVIAYIARRFTHTKNALSRNEATSNVVCAKVLWWETITSNMLSAVCSRLRNHAFHFGVDVADCTSMSTQSSPSMSFSKGRSTLSQVTRSITLGEQSTSILEQNLLPRRTVFFRSSSSVSSYVAQQERRGIRGN